MSIEPTKKIDQFRAKRILEVGKVREMTFDEELTMSHRGNVVSISAQDLGKIMKVPFDSKDHRVFLDNLNEALPLGVGLLSRPVSVTQKKIENLHFIFKEDALLEIAQGSKRSK